MKSGNLNFLKPSGPLQACNGTAFLHNKEKARLKTCVFIFQLFDFDFEVEPILEVLVGKTVQHALTEVLEEEELEGLRAQQRRFRELRASEQAELQRLEEQERRLPEEKVTKAPQAFQQNEITLTEIF